MPSLSICALQRQGFLRETQVMHWALLCFLVEEGSWIKTETKTLDMKKANRTIELLNMEVLQHQLCCKNLSFMLTLSAIKHHMRLCIIYVDCLQSIEQCVQPALYDIRSADCYTAMKNIQNSTMPQQNSQHET